MHEPGRVLIVDDQEVFANALRLWLETRDGIEVVVGEVLTAAERAERRSGRGHPL